MKKAHLENGSSLSERIANETGKQRRSQRVPQNSKAQFLFRRYILPEKKESLPSLD